MLHLLLILTALLAVVVAYVLELNSLERLQGAVRRLFSGAHWTVAVYDVDEKSERHGGELVAETLKAHDVDTVFTLVGGHISPILVACERLGIRVVDTRHEVTTVFAADATARLKQSIGVAMVTAGPGLTNTVTAVKNAQMAESPVLLIGGAAATLLKGRGALQDIDQMSLFKPICKQCISVRRVKDIPQIVCYAINKAMSDTPGPVFVEMPIDVLYPYPLVYKELGVIDKPKSFMQKVVNNYLRWHIARQFGEAFKARSVADYAPLPVNTPRAAYGDGKERLSMAQRPLLLIGSQALLPPIGASKLRKTVKALGIPCYLGGMARGLLGRSGDGLQMRQKRRDALRDADVVILAGAVCDFRLSYGRVLSRKSKVIEINRNSDQLTKNTDMFWKADLAMQADVASTLCEIVDRLGESYKGAPNEWIETLQQREAEVEAKNARMAEEKPETHLNPIAVCMALEKALPEEAILVADGGDFVATAAYTIRCDARDKYMPTAMHFRPRGPLRWLDPGAFGTLGVGGGFALGAKLACPDKPVFILYGDGSLGYSLMEFDTYKRHKSPVCAIVGNDACWTQIAREQVPMFKTSVACDLEYTHYEEMLLPLDANGLHLTAEDESQLERRFKESFDQYVSSGKSSLLNVLIGKSKFREGSISV